MLGALSDRWVPISSFESKNWPTTRDSRCLEFKSDGILIDLSQAHDFKKYNDWGSYNLVNFKKSTLDRYKLRNYAILSKFFYFLFENLHKYNYHPDISEEKLRDYFDYCFSDTADALNEDIYFKENSTSTGSKKINYDELLVFLKKIGKQPSQDIKPINKKRKSRI